MAFDGVGRWHPIVVVRSANQRCIFLEQLKCSPPSVNQEALVRGPNHDYSLFCWIPRLDIPVFDVVVGMDWSIWKTADVLSSDEVFIEFP